MNTLDLVFLVNLLVIAVKDQELIVLLVSRALDFTIINAGIIAQLGTLLILSFNVKSVLNIVFLVRILMLVLNVKIIIFFSKDIVNKNVLFYITIILYLTNAWDVNKHASIVFPTQDVQVVLIICFSIMKHALIIALLDLI